MNISPSCACLHRKTLEKQHSGMQKRIVCEQAPYVHIRARLFVRIYPSWDSDKQLRISPWPTLLVNDSTFYQWETEMHFYFTAVTVKEVVWGIVGLCLWYMCDAYVNMQLYWSWHLKISLLWLPLCWGRKWMGATETYVIGVTVTIHLAKCASCIMHVFACMFTCTYSWLPL